MSHIWEYLRTRLWFLPAVLVSCAVALALILIEVELHADWQERFPRLFGAGAEGARGMLSTIAGSMITVAGVTFSITVVALALASGQYTSRILRNFMRDRATHTVLGIFLGVYAYCLIVMRTIRGGDEGAFVPSVAVLGSVVLAFVGIGFLIFFIHHVSSAIQASSIIAGAATETLDAVDRLFPTGFGEPDDTAANDTAAYEGTIWTSVPAAQTGFVQRADLDALLRFAVESETTVKMERGIGEFATAGAPLLSIAASAVPDADATRQLNAAYSVGRHRTIVQDAGYGIRQIVDVALKALSPGINDTTTAVECVDYLGAILAQAARRRIETPCRREQGKLRLMVRGPSFEGFLDSAFDQIRQNAAANVAVLTRLLQILETVGLATVDPQRRLAVWKHAELIANMADRTIAEPSDREAVLICLDGVWRVVGKGRCARRPDMNPTEDAP